MARETMSNHTQGNASSSGWEQEHRLFDSRRWELNTAGAIDRATPVGHSSGNSWLLADVQSNNWDHSRKIAWETEVTGIASLYHGIIEPKIWAIVLPVPALQEDSLTETYRGKVREIVGNLVLVEVDSPDNPDIREAYIPLASFDRSPDTGEEFRCDVITRGAVTITQANLLPRNGQSTLEDFGIDEQELLDWASSLEDV